MGDVEEAVGYAPATPKGEGDAVSCQVDLGECQCEFVSLLWCVCYCAQGVDAFGAGVPLSGLDRPSCCMDHLQKLAGSCLLRRLYRLPSCE